MVNAIDKRTPVIEPAEWSEEQLRYRVLRSIHDISGGRCEKTVTGTEVGTALGLRYEDLFRVIHYLEHNGFLDYLGAGPRVCITMKGIRYIREQAGRRRSIRTLAWDGGFARAG